MNRRKFLAYVNRVAFVVEAVISLILLIGIVISIPDIIKYYVEILSSGIEVSYELFKQFLSHVLLLVVAIEFVLLMIAHTESTIIHLICLVIARKLLVYSDNMKDLLIGVVAILILFLVRKYLTDTEPARDTEYIFTAAKEIEFINNTYDIEIHAGNIKTLGGYVSKLLEEKSVPAETGSLVDDGEYLYEIQKTEMGIIQLISIDRIKNSTKYHTKGWS
ncbi:hypothetical protein LV469_06710 [Peptoniphilus sp. GNH]|nr:hypothetical protein LV469_06710 [Peptoniphilus sp. GNH]